MLHNAIKTYDSHQGEPVQWVNVKDGDSVSAEGITTRRAAPTGAALVVPARMEVITVAVDGEISGRVGTDAECNIEYQVMSGRIEPGMAGGHVFNAENKAVGIIKGYVDHEGTKGTLIVPYAEIQKAWTVAQARQ